MSAGDGKIPDISENNKSLTPTSSGDNLTEHRSPMDRITAMREGSAKYKSYAEAVKKGIPKTKSDNLSEWDKPILLSGSKELTRNDIDHTGEIFKGKTI